MNKHTEGPWRVLPEEVHKDYIRVRGTSLGRRYKIANVLTVSYAGVPDSEAEETRANARLIASSPRILEALKVLLEAADPWLGDKRPSLKEAMREARAAIQEATSHE